MFAAAVFLVTLQAQEARTPFTRTERFVGDISLQRPRPQTVSVGIHQWIVRERQLIAALEMPARGTTVVQLRTGRLTTIINGERQSRNEGAFWTVPAGAAMGIVTGDDSAIIQTIVVASAR
jgi:hypothetical protein